MAHSAPVHTTEEEAVGKVHAIFENQLSKLPAEEQAQRWDALAEYLKKSAAPAAPADAAAKR
jgi:hypothetical protein